MVGKKKSEITDYMMWSKAVTRYAKIFIFGICILVVLFAVGLNVLDKTSVVFLASTIAILIWCGSAYLILRKMLTAKESLRTATRNVERPEITNPLFKELFDEYEFNQLEGFTQNIFFHAWKLTCVDDYNSIISLCFTKKQHEISIDLSEKEVSIIIDEETDSPVELVMNMHDFNSLDELFNTITAACRDSLSKKDQ